MAQKARRQSSRDGPVILGIDPGLRVTGYGLVVQSGNEISALGHGVLAVDARLPLAERLRTLFDALREVIAHNDPAEVAIEQPFVAANVRSAMAVGEARAIAVLAAAQAGLPVHEYSPAEVKQSVCGYGRGPKEQVQEMVRLQLGLDAAPQPADAADALATALCHLIRRRAKSLLQEPV
jgi:crossover junction endodeoxyribonuclease RuvC